MRHHPSRNSIPLYEISWHFSTKVKDTTFALLDNGMVGFAGRFRVRCYVADHLVSDEVFDTEVGARKVFERKVEEHYES